MQVEIVVKCCRCENTYTKKVYVNYGPGMMAACIKVNAEFNLPDEWEFVNIDNNIQCQCKTHGGGYGGDNRVENIRKATSIYEM